MRIRKRYMKREIRRGEELENKRDRDLV